MIELNHHDIEKVLHLTDVPALQFVGVSYDTRQELSGTLYIAIIGETHDGHDYCQAAKDNGAAALLVSRQVDVDLPQIIVDDTLIALGLLASYWRDQCHAQIIGITGSNGKTSLKNLLASILCEAVGSDKVLFNFGNFNNHIGMPLTLCRLNKQHQYAVLEMGMNHFGELDYLSKLAKPHVVCINNVFAVHTEFVGDIDGVAKAKCEIYAGLDQQGVVILNADNSHFEYCKQQAADFAVKTFAVEKKADVTATNIQLKLQSSSFTAHCSAGDVDVNLPIPGKHYIANALAAISCATAAGVNDHNAIQQGLANVRLEKNRMNFVRGLNGVLLIDDCYNANPESLTQSVKILLQQPGRKVLVMGDLGELGKDTESIHAELGKQFKEMGVDVLFSCGELAKKASDAFQEPAYHFDDKNKMIETLKTYCNQETTILIKASLSMGYAEVVNALLA